VRTEPPAVVPPARVGSRYRTGTPPLWVAVLAALLLALIAVDLLHTRVLPGFDHAVSREMVRWNLRHSAAKPLIYAFTLFGQRGTVLGVTIPIVAFLCWRDRSIRIAAVYVLALVLIALTVYGLKDGTHRTAPPLDQLHVASGASFPSGHLVNATVLWWLVATCALTVPVEAWIQRTLVAIAWLAPLAVIASMTLLDYHWISDCAGALCLGVALRYVLELARTVWWRRTATPRPVA
jgi:membrane-associated phospholipid phosphatase